LTLPVGKYSELRKNSKQLCLHAKECNSGLEVERVRVLGALRSFGFKKKLEAEKRTEMHSLSNEGTEKWIEDYIGRETTVARKEVEDAETAI